MTPREEDGYYLECRDYRIIRYAGSGGSTKFASDNVKDTQFAIKYPTRKEVLIQESEILQNINHDNIICFYGALEEFYDGDHIFKLFLEYPEGTCKLLFLL